MITVKTLVTYLGFGFFFVIYELIVNFCMKRLVKLFLLVYNSRALSMKGLVISE